MFGFPEPAKLAGASAIVLDVDNRLVGLVVSSVSDVLQLAPDEIAPTPELGTRAVAAAHRGHRQAPRGQRSARHERPAARCRLRDAAGPRERA
jgi:chemotaxis signal transduction protein